MLEVIARPAEGYLRAFADSPCLKGIPCEIYEAFPIYCLSKCKVSK